MHTPHDSTPALGADEATSLPVAPLLPARFIGAALAVLASSLAGCSDPGSTTNPTCTSDTCAPTGEVCSAKSGQCLPCIADADCKTGRCAVDQDETKASCVECLSNSDCAPGQTCGQNTCADNCAVAANCRAPASVCDAAGSKACVACLTASDCTDPQLPVCVDKRCVARCTATNGCTSDKHCDTATPGGLCVECTSDAHCPGRKCDLGKKACVDCLTAPSDTCAAGFFCDTSGSAPACKAGCKNGPDCPQKETYCSNHQCVPGCTAAYANCEAGQTCVNGVCFGAKWSARASSPAPSARAYAAMAFDAKNGVTMLYGGHDNSGTILSDTWEWNGATWKQRTPATSPGPVTMGAMVYDEASQRILLFGGSSVYPCQNALNDTWAWDGQTWTRLTTATKPPHRCRHGMAFDSTRNRTVVFGGQQPGVYFGDTWEFDGTDWAQLAPSTSPAARIEPAMVFDKSSKRTVLFAGAGSPNSSACGGVQACSDTWSFDGSNWTKLTTPAPTGRQEMSMAYDALRGRIILFGGVSEGLATVNETWEFDGQVWSMVSPASQPSARVWPSMAYDPLRRRVVLFGGKTTSQVVGDTWVYGGP